MRMVDGDALAARLEAECREWEGESAYQAGLCAAAVMVAEAPTVEPQETRFVHRYSRPGVYADLLLHCEKCDGTIEKYATPKYCPWCGRKVKHDGSEQNAEHSPLDHG